MSSETLNKAITTAFLVILLFCGFQVVGYSLFGEYPTLNWSTRLNKINEEYHYKSDEPDLAQDVRQLQADVQKLQSMVLKPAEPEAEPTPLSFTPSILKESKPSDDNVEIAGDTVKFSELDVGEFFHFGSSSYMKTPSHQIEEQLNIDGKKVRKTVNCVLVRPKDSGFPNVPLFMEGHHTVVRID